METSGQTMVGTEVAALFLRHRIQPLQARDHQMWLYTGKRDSTRYNEADFLEEELLDEVRWLTSLTKDDVIPLEAVADPYDFKNLPDAVSPVN